MNNYERVSFDLTKKLKELGFNPNNYMGTWRQYFKKELYNPRKDEYVSMYDDNPIVLELSNSVSDKCGGVFLMYAITYCEAFEFLMKEVESVYTPNSRYVLTFEYNWVLKKVEEGVTYIIAEGKESCLKSMISLIESN